MTRYQPSHGFSSHEKPWHGGKCWRCSNKCQYLNIINHASGSLLGLLDFCQFCHVTLYLCSPSCCPWASPTSQYLTHASTRGAPRSRGELNCGITFPRQWRRMHGPYPVVKRLRQQEQMVEEMSSVPNLTSAGHNLAKATRAHLFYSATAVEIDADVHPV